MQTYDNSIYDFAVGFRRNSEAIAVYKNTKKFYTPTKESDIEIAEAFKLYLDALVPQQSPKKQQKIQQSSWQRTQSKQQEGNRSRRRNNPSPRKSISDSRSRSRSRDREEYSRFHIALLPFEIKRDKLQQRIADYVACSPQDIVIEDQKLQFPCVAVTVQQGNIDYNNFYKYIPQGLLIRQEQTCGSNIRVQVRRRQMRAVKQGVYRPTEQTFLELAHWLVGCRGDVKVLHILFQDSSFLVTVAGRLNLRELRLAGWKFQYVHHTPRMTPSLQDRWYAFLDKSYDGYSRLPVQQ